jgi:hypothetical protein
MAVSPDRSLGSRTSCGSRPVCLIDGTRISGEPRIGSVWSPRVRLPTVLTTNSNRESPIMAFYGMDEGGQQGRQMGEAGGVDAAKADFFISYTAADQDAAEWIAWVLEDAGYQTVIQAWDFRPGHEFVAEMQQALVRAERVLAVLSPAYLDSRFARQEWNAALASDPTGSAGRLLPVRVAEVSLEGLDRPRIYVDLVALSKEEARARLLAGVRGERAKPAAEPGYPVRLGRPPIVNVPRPVVASPVVETTTRSVDLEIGLRWNDMDRGFYVNVHYSNPGNEAEISWFGEEPLPFDLDRLAWWMMDDSSYGQMLSDNLFRPQELREIFAQARSEAERDAVILRLLLSIDPRAPAEYHALRWETLCDPRDGRFIATMRNILFSRHLRSSGLRPIPARLSHEQSALIVLANPRNLDQYEPHGQRLSPFDIDRELGLAQTALSGYRVTVVASPGSLNGIIAQLDRGSHDILYLVCHGAFISGRSVLYLEDPDGSVAPTTGATLAARLGELVRRPTLIVLVVPWIGGTEAAGRDDGTLAALGVRLAETGVAAIVGMQDSIDIGTFATLMPIFFEELQQDGWVDRAMAVARSTIQERPHWWSPVLFVRLKSGRIWRPVAQV